MTVSQQGPTFPTLSWYEGIAYCLPTLLAVPSRGMHPHTPALAEPQTLASVLHDQHMRAFSHNSSAPVHAKALGFTFARLTLTPYLDLSRTCLACASAHDRALSSTWLYRG